MFTVVLGQFGDDPEVYTEFIDAADSAGAAVEVARQRIHKEFYSDMAWMDFQEMTFSLFAVFHGWQENLV